MKKKSISPEDQKGYEAILKEKIESETEFIEQPIIVSTYKPPKVESKKKKTKSGKKKAEEYKQFKLNIPMVFAKALDLDKEEHKALFTLEKAPGGKRRLIVEVIKK